MQTVHTDGTSFPNIFRSNFGETVCRVVVLHHVALCLLCCIILMLRYVTLHYVYVTLCYVMLRCILFMLRYVMLPYAALCCILLFGIVLYSIKCYLLLHCSTT